MKKLGMLLLVLTGIYSCQPSHPTEYLSFSGKLDNYPDSLLVINGPNNFKKEITVSKSGTFKDSLSVEKGDYYSISSLEGKRGFIYLKNGYNLNLTGDYNSFLKSFKYEGNTEGAQSNNLLIDRFNISQDLGNIGDLMAHDKEIFQSKVEKLKKDVDSIISLYPKADEELIKTSVQQQERLLSDIESNYDRMHESILRERAALARIEKGKVAPEFHDYVNFKGGKKSLKDFRGNYVYIDVWATWCRPCIAQIPFLKKLEKDYEGKNLKIVSISTDNDRRSGGSWENAKAKWEKMVKDKNLSGVQLWAGKDELRFSQDYMVSGIPRFILIDPEGKIVDPNAPRPFDPKIRTYFDSLLK